MAATMLKMSGIHKWFPGVHALKNVDFDLRAGEVHTLVGENGAGKSTLINVLYGALHKDSGLISLDDREVYISSPTVAQKLGIHAVQQHFSLIPTMSVAENLYFGSHPRGLFNLIDWKQLHADAQSFLERIGFGTVSAHERVERLSVAEAQKVEIAKAIKKQPRVLIMDEPSAVLPEQDVKNLFRLIEDLRAAGSGIIYISHHLDEVFEISDRISVLKDGENVDTISPDSVDHYGLVERMVGRELRDMYPTRKKPATTETVLSVRNVSTDRIHDVSFDLFKGEILGIAGLIGSGRTELCHALFGLDRLTGGKISVWGKDYRPAGPADAIRNRLGFVTEDRHREGLVLTRDVATNITFVGSRRLARAGFLNPRRNNVAAQGFVNRLRIATPGLRQVVKFLSGGNQQKVVLAKWLFVEPQILLLDEPTRGIDVGAKAEIYRLIDELTQQGFSVVLVSSELQEVLGVSDRVLVMRGGTIAGEFAKEQATEQVVIACASGV